MNTLYRFLSILLTLLLLAFGNSKTIVIEGEKLYVQGKGTLYYLGLIKVYNAVYYSGSVNGIQALKITYLRSISAKDFKNSTTVFVKKNTSPKEFAAIENRLVYYNSLYRSVNPGDRYLLVYMPGKGTTLYLNSKPLGTVTGKDFARALFNVWLGKRPVSKTLKKSLLGDSP